jgi:hypothetical protein
LGPAVTLAPVVSPPPSTDATGTAAALVSGPICTDSLSAVGEGVGVAGGGLGFDEGSGELVGDGSGFGEGRCGGGGDLGLGSGDRNVGVDGKLGEVKGEGELI